MKCLDPSKIKWHMDVIIWRAALYFFKYTSELEETRRVEDVVTNWNAGKEMEI
jgi:hypothetical protein